jgi:hypothetical protein
MQELFPVACGIAVGLVVGGLRPSLRLAAGAALSCLLGLTATVITGEFRAGWEYVLIDIPLVAVSASLSFLLARTAVLRLRPGG